MTVYAYLRVSTDRQDVDNQRHGMLEYANARGLAPIRFVEDTISGRVKWRERTVGRLLTETACTGDIVLFSEISRMARSTLQVLDMLEHCMERGLIVHIAKQQMVLDIIWPKASASGPLPSSWSAPPPHSTIGWRGGTSGRGGGPPPRANER